MVDQRIALMLGKSRTKMGKSQEYMANEIGVARKTVQNWESSVSCPTAEQTIRWFEILNLSALPYLLEYLHPSMENIKAKDDDKKIRDALSNVFKDFPDTAIRQLLFILYGDHGSSPNAVLNMVTAHLQTPMKDRLVTASIIEKNYEIAKVQGRLSSPNHVQPDMELLHQGIEEGSKAVIAGLESYTLKSENKAK